MQRRNSLQLTVISHYLADRFLSLIDHVEGAIHRHVIPEASIRQLSKDELRPD